MDLKLIQKNEPQRYVLGIVYSPEETDCQGDYSTAPEIEKACHGFMKSLQNQSAISKQMTDGILKALADCREIELDITDVYDDIQKGALGFNHVNWDDSHGDIVESYIMPVDCEINGEVVKAGTWMMGVILSQENYEKVQKGELTGFSMGGKGERIPDEVKKEVITALQQAFNELKEHLLENSDDLDEEDLQSRQADNKEWLLLLLLGRFNFKENFAEIFTNMLTAYSDQALGQAFKDINKLGKFSLTVTQQKELIDSIVTARLDFILPEIERSTFRMLSTAIRSAKDTKSVKKAISEAYAVNDERATTIEETEFVTTRNATRVMLAETSGLVAGVLVSDGDGCAVCPTIDGQVWSLDYASGNLLQHPHCVRSFTFLTADEVEDYGGLDEGYDDEYIPITQFRGHSLPETGPANSGVDFIDKDGTIKRRRFFNESRNKELDIDLKHGGVKHTFPHAHDWGEDGRSDARELTKREKRLIKDIKR